MNKVHGPGLWYLDLIVDYVRQVQKPMFETAICHKIKFFWGLLWSDEHKTPSHCLGLRHDCNGVSRIRSHWRKHTVLPAHARILGFEIIRSIQQTVDRHPMKHLPCYTKQGPLLPNTRTPEQRGNTTVHTVGLSSRISPSNKAHHPAQPISTTSLSTGLGWLIVLHITFLLFS